MKKLVSLIALMTLLPLSLMAQKLYKFDVSSLLLAEKGNLNTEDVDIQFFLINEDLINDAVQNVIDKMTEVREEFYHNVEIAKLQNEKIPDENDPEIRKALEEVKDMPELRKQILEGLKLARQQKQEILGENKPVKYSYNVKALLEEAKKLSIGGRFYSGHVDMGNGRYMMAIGPNHGNRENNYYSDYDETALPEASIYTWGMFNAEGQMILPFEYHYFGHDKDFDVIFLTHKEKNGTTKAGTMDFEGKVKTPFQFKDWMDIFYTQDDASFVDQNGKIGLMGFDGKMYFTGQFDVLIENTGGESWYNVSIGNARKRVFFNTHELK